MTVQSEPSPDYPNLFSGGFDVDFVAQAKAVVGSVDALAPAAPCSVAVEAFCSVFGGPNKQVCRIGVTKSPMHWEHVSHQCAGKTFRVFKYGMHGVSDKRPRDDNDRD